MFSAIRKFFTQNIFKRKSSTNPLTINKPDSLTDNQTNKLPLSTNNQVVTFKTPEAYIYKPSNIIMSSAMHTPASCLSDFPLNPQQVLARFVCLSERLIVDLKEKQRKLAFKHERAKMQQHLHFKKLRYYEYINDVQSWTAIRTWELELDVILQKVSKAHTELVQGKAKLQENIDRIDRQLTAVKLYMQSRERDIATVSVKTFRNARHAKRLHVIRQRIPEYSYPLPPQGNGCIKVSDPT